MTPYGLFLGCQIPARLPQYQAAATAVLARLGIQPVEVPQFNCCGYPLRNIDAKMFLLCAARNMAVARARGLQVLALCKCCYGSLKTAAALLGRDPKLQREINSILGREGLEYQQDQVEIHHFLPLLANQVGLDAIKAKVQRKFSGLKVAAHYGCHALRPSDVVAFDDPADPDLFERLIEVTGAEAVPWSRRLDCCGAPLLGSNDELASRLTAKKLASSKEAGAHYLCTGCPYCQLQFDIVQDRLAAGDHGNGRIAALLYPQLLGLSLGIEGHVLGLQMNRVPLEGIHKFFAPPAGDAGKGESQGED